MFYFKLISSLFTGETVGPKLMELLGTLTNSYKSYTAWNNINTRSINELETLGISETKAQANSSICIK